MVCGPRSLFGGSCLHGSASILSPGWGREAEGGGGRAEGAQVELGQVVDGLRQQGHAVLHGTGDICQDQGQDQGQLRLHSGGYCWVHLPFEDCPEVEDPV